MPLPTPIALEITITAETTLFSAGSVLRLVNAHVRGFPAGDVVCTVAATGQAAEMLAKREIDKPLAVGGRLVEGVVQIIGDSDLSRDALSRAA